MALIGGPQAYWPDLPREVRVTREQLYELAWSAPMTQLAAELKMTGSGLAQALRAQDIPLPERGYWNKVQAGKPARRIPLPPRKPGQDALLHVHGTLADRFRSEPAEPENPEGPFATAAVPEDLEQLRLDTLKQVGKVTVTAKLDRPHRALQALLRQDERRREKVAAARFAHWERAPEFDTPDQLRKLRIANALMLGLARLGHGCQLWGSEPAPSFCARVGDHEVRVRIHRQGEKLDRFRHHGDPLPSPSKAPLQIELLGSLPDGFKRSWQDGEEKLERHLAEVAATIVAAGEARYRLSIAERLEQIAHMNAWRVERRQEALAKQNKERLAGLHRSAELLRTANDLRTLIATVRAAISNGRRELDPSALSEWEAWAAAEADRIDPVVSGQVDEHLVPAPIKEWW
jgi:hypothetical protein